MAAWSEAEFAGAALGDGRLNKRLIRLADIFADKPTASIPGACSDWAETQAAYRFFDQSGRKKNPMGWQDALNPHMRQTTARMGQHRVVLCLQDTTELDFNAQRITGLGPLSYEAQRGMYLHPTYAVTPEREPLGVLDAWMWAREPKAADGTRPGLIESERWIEGYRRLAELAPELPGTRLIYVADREADMRALMQCAQSLGTPLDWLVRARHNRTLPEGGKLWAKVLATPVLGGIEFTLPARPGQSERRVRQEVRSLRVTLTPQGELPLEVTCVIAREIDPPAGIKPLEWRLLTNREAGTFEAAVQLIDWYRARWEIEIFFHVLKNGCRVEALQLASLPKIELALAIYLVVAWRLSRLMRLGRVHPDLEAALFFTREEWEAAYILGKKPVPKTMPSVRNVIRQIAQLGGFLGRKCDGEPGVKTLWIGLQRVRDFVQGMEFMRKAHVK